jgi:hypothetical protein
LPLLAIDRAYLKTLIETLPNICFGEAYLKGLQDIPPPAVY